MVAYYGSNSVVLYTNEGGGDWSTQVLGNIEHPSDVFAADLNGEPFGCIHVYGEVLTQIY